MWRLNILFLNVIFICSACGQEMFDENTQSRPDVSEEKVMAASASLSPSLSESLSAEQKSKLRPLVDKKLYTEAIDYLSLELEQNPGDINVRVLLGVLYVLQGQSDQALLILQKGSPDADHYLAQLMTRFKSGLLYQDLLDLLQASTDKTIRDLLVNLRAPETSVAKEAMEKHGPLIKEWNIDPVQEFQEPAQLAYQVKVVMKLNADTQGLGNYIANMTRREGYSPQLPMPGQQVEQTLKGKLTLDDLGRDTNGQRWLQMQWYDEGSTLKVPGYSEQERIDQAFQYGLTNELARGPFLLKLSANSEIETFYAHSEMSPDIIERFLFVANTLVVKFPDGALVQGPPPQWMKKEWDASGQYKAQYRITEADNALWKLSKTKTSYLQLPASVRQQARLKIVESPAHVSSSGDLEVQWSPMTGLVNAVNGELTMQVDNQYIKSDASGKVELVPVPRNVVAPFQAVTRIGEMAGYLQKLQAFPLSENLDGALRSQRRNYKNRHLSDEERANIETRFNNFLEEIAPIMTQGQSVDKKEVSRIQKKLAHMAKAHPTLMMMLFERHLKKSEFQSPLAALLMRAAVKYGGQPGEALVGQAIRHPNVRTQFKSLGVISLGKSKNLSTVGEAVLHDLVKNPYQDTSLRIVSEQACYMVANSVRRENNTQQFNRGVNLLLSELENAERLWRKLQLLRGFTNAGHPKVLDVIGPYLNDRSEYGKYVRVAAFQAMRMNKSPEASAIFLDALIKEDSFYVKNRAVPLIAEMVLTEPQRQQVAKYLEKEPKRVLVAPALMALGAHGEKAIPIIEQYVDDPRDNVRQAAFEALKYVKTLGMKEVGHE